jgi:non-ribosomal peptide synthetase component F
VVRGDRVGLGVSRGLPMVIGMLATWQCGAAYVPLDPTYPSDRLNFMIDDAAPKAVLVDPASDLGHGRPGLAVLEIGAPAPSPAAQPTQLLAADRHAYSPRQRWPVRPDRPTKQ